MIDFIIFLLSVIGSTMITTQSYLFKPIRLYGEKINKHLGKLLKCTQCSGFYWGVIIKIIMLISERNDIIFYISDINLILFGFIGSFISYLTYLLLKPLINKYD
jgi:hypothetical protein